MYILNKACFKQIAHYMESKFPNEACGVITTDDDKKLLSYFYPIRNNHPNQRHFFSYDPNDWIKTIYLIQKRKQTLVCYVHSHIGGAPTLSLADIEGIENHSALQGIYHYTKKDSPSLYFYRYNNSTKTYEYYPLSLT